MTISPSEPAGPQKLADDDGAFTVEEFCARYGIKRTATYEEINRGRLEARKRGNRTLIPRTAARRWLENLPFIKSRGAESSA
jgi:excisionase family DNA binding protein